MRKRKRKKKARLSNCTIDSVAVIKFDIFSQHSASTLSTSVPAAEAAGRVEQQLHVHGNDAAKKCAEFANASSRERFQTNNFSALSRCCSCTCFVRLLATEQAFAGDRRRVRAAAFAAFASFC